MAGSTAQGSLSGDPHSYERRRTHGPEPRRRVGMHGTARSASLIHLQRARPCRPVPLLVCVRRLASGEPAADRICVGPGRSLLLAPPSSSAERGASALPAGSTKESRQCQAKDAASKAGDPAQESSKTQYRPSAIFALAPERLTCWRFDDDARNVKTLDKVRPMRDEARKFCPRTMNGTTADDQDPYRDRYLRPH
jgi:hypothetical protein